MKITRININRLSDEERQEKRISDKVLGYATIVLNYGFAVHDIKVMSGEKGPYLIFPLDKAGKYIANPMNEETRQYILKEIMQEIGEVA